MSNKKEESEFGKGLCYCLGLFLAHAGRISSDLKAYESIGNEEKAYSMWFYAAADHLYDFQPKYAPKGLIKRCKSFQDRVLSLRLPMAGEPEATESDYNWAIQEAKDLLRLIDKKNSVPTGKGRNE